MASKSVKGTKKKAPKWPKAHEAILLRNVEKHVLCLRRAFEITAEEVHRSTQAVAAHWYQSTSKKCGRALFMTVSGSHMAVNRKNSKGQPIKLPLYKKLLVVLGLHY